jgi:hypothetical protein
MESQQISPLAEQFLLHIKNNRFTEIDLDWIIRLSVTEISKIQHEAKQPLVVELDKDFECPYPTLADQAWHHKQPKVNLDLDSFVFKQSCSDGNDCETIGTFIRKFGCRNSPNQHFISALLSSKGKAMIPEGVFKGRETIIAGTGYKGNGRECVQSIYRNNGQWDWGIVPLDTPLESRFFQLILLPEKTKSAS